jgi:hypothetical protein
MKRLMKRGTLCLFESPDANPLFTQLVGMASRLKRYVSGEKEAEQLGPFGELVKKKVDTKLPLLGQIESGIALLSNNLYACPVFYHEADDLYFCNKTANEVYFSEAGHLYSCGQQEPQKEVLNPYSRAYYYFMK